MDTSNEAVFRRWIDEGLNRRNLDVLRDCRTDNFTWHGGGTMLGLTGYREWVLAYWAAFADLHAEIGEVIEAGDRLICRWTWHGTHTGELMGLPATGKKVRLEGITIARFHRRKIAEEWEVADLFDLFTSLGVFPEIRERVHAY